MGLDEVTVANDVPWFSGVGGKARMREYVQLHYPDRQAVEIVVQDPETGYRSFLPFHDWPEAWEALQALDGHRRHANEVVQLTQPCKPYLDVDCAGEPNGIAGDDIVPALVRGILHVFEQDYRRPIAPEDIVVTRSPNQAKLSWHIVVSTHQPQLVFRCNHRSEPHGAYQLARRLSELEPAAGAYIDLAVYSKDR